jgi:hypothetical protein
MTTETETMVARSSDQIAADMDILRTAIAENGADSPTFAQDVATYTALLTEYDSTVRAENASAIDDAKVRLAEGIHSLVESLGLADLLREPVSSVRYTFTAGEEDDPDVASVVLNPTGRAKSTTSAKPRASTGNGDRRDLQAIFEANANEDERAKASEIEGKHGKDGTDPDPKKFNSNMWSLKNRVAARVGQ